MSLVSVILPTYNRSDSLCRAAKSVLDQSYADLELIVVDDASTENIEAVVRQWNDERVRLVRRAANGGAAAARNTGLAHAKGRFIAFQDSDDIWLPGKLDRQMKLLATLPPSVGAVTGSKLLYRSGNRQRRVLPQVSVEPAPENAISLECDQLEHLLWENRLSVQNALFRRDCYPCDEWFDPRAKANEDWDFAVRLARRTKIFEHLEPVVLAFASADSVSSSNRRQHIGAVRLMKKNKDLKPRFPQHFSYNEFYLGRFLAATGKPRLGFRFVAAALVAYPSLLKLIIRRKLERAFGRISLRGMEAGTRPSTRSENGDAGGIAVACLQKATMQGFCEPTDCPARSD
ncbi:glycosyltransferase family 2 protein [Mesorhizobium sp. RP14(2022)]|uniref:Glycosyltransferase family 2 protein n=1 Tax=Mesorhizobium liriopis TaxID=2953882 RepID=A0ABT1C2S2_9HYPH|nr:glycosyltransferase family 2 protein [Mesorhizobium liriopis]MCO6049120.1 glycosyltransferase family 2 protein [Mesorhizobium liriopis]